MNKSPVVPMVNRRMAVLAMAGVAAELAGCGGGGGGMAGLSSGGTGSFSSGTVTGLGSIIVNGVRYDDSTAIVVRGDDETDTAPLQVGMVVAIQSSAVTPGSGSAMATAKASRICYGSEWVGRVTAKTATSFTMLGQTVDVLATTVFIGTRTQLADLVADPATGDCVEVHGYLNLSTGHLQATLVEVKAATPAAFRLTGIVTALDTTARTFQLAGQSFQYFATTPVPPTWTVGSLVRVRFAPVPVNGVWQVSRVTLRGSELEQLSVEDHAGSEVSGTVTAFTSATQFSVNGIPVDASGATVSGTVALGVNVEIRGTLVAGTLVATSVRVETETELEQADYEFFGPVSNLDTTARTFTLKGLAFSYTASTVIDSSLAGLWTTGATPTVEVKAVLQAGVWTATDIKLES